MFGQLVIGPPGSGKSTYCRAMAYHLRENVRRNVIIINLDPANDTPPYAADVDVQNLVDVQEVMERLSLGPNGGILFCMEYIDENFDQLKELILQDNTYLIFDCPGQVELYTHHDSFRHIVEKLTKWGIQLCVVSLVDSHYCTDPAKFISVLLTSLSSMLHLELPHINVLSKIDLIDKMGQLAFKLNYYTDVLDLSYLVDELDERVCSKRFIKLNSAISGLVEDYHLVSFYPLNVQDTECVHRLCRAIDKANGYVYGELEERSVIVCALSVLLINEFFGYSKYVKPVTKTLASIGFLIAGVNYELLDSDQGYYVFIGLILSAIGDVMLISHRPLFFQIGAVFFLAAHIMYCGAFITTGISIKWFLLSIVVIAPALLIVYKYILPYTSGIMRKLVITYTIAISWMMAFASGSYGYSGRAWLLGAAFFFYLSDFFVARQRFLKRAFLNSLCGLTLYYAAQLMFAVSPSISY